MPRKIMNLGGDDWRLGPAPASAAPTRATWQELDQVTDWLPATVPGNVRADLVRAGYLPDLSYGTQAESARWVDDHHWWLVRDFCLPHTLAQRVHLVLRGIDYIADLLLNGQHLGRHEGMFSPQLYDVTALLRDENRLAVRILGSRWLPSDRSTRREKFLNVLEARSGGLPGHYPHRRDTLKCQMSFGWDFAPPLRTMGIWDEVYAVVSTGVHIRDVAVVQQITASAAELEIEIELDVTQGGSAQLHCTLAGETFESEPTLVRQQVALQPGASRHSLKARIPEPRLWWPWDHGRPDLYRLSVKVWQEGKLLDSMMRTIGLRQIELEGWALRINGRRVYARGANWVPASILPGTVCEEEYAALLQLAREANMNMLRVWGGGLREKRAFYELCDRLGILVWQEFPLACAFLTRYPRSRAFLQLLEGEARAIVRDLRGHASVAVWCGGNEFSPERNAPLVEVLAQVVAQEDPARPFLPASPGDGDGHNWQVWHNAQPPKIYRQDASLFASEFGLQAPPSLATLRRFLPPRELETPGPAWVYHGAGLKKLERYARPFLRKETPSTEEWIEASQQAQAHGLQIAIEHYRRRKARGGGGVLVWQFNEPWPAISWALLDHYRQPKPAFETVRRLFTPVLISLDYVLQRYTAGNRFRPQVWLINDSADTLQNYRLEVILEDGVGQEVQRWTQVVDVAAGSAGVVAELDWTLPSSKGWRVACRLGREGQTLATNEYDLGTYDGIRPALARRVRAWLTGLFTPG